MGNWEVGGGREMGQDKSRAEGGKRAQKDR